MLRRPYFYQMDIDGNGLIDLEEFCLCMARYITRKQQKAAPAPKHSLSSKQLRDAFNYFDKVRVHINIHIYIIYIYREIFVVRDLRTLHPRGR